MTNYLYALSEDDMDVLYEIIAMKYRKFIRLYWLLKDFSDNIIKLKYKEKTELNVLKIVVVFSNIDVDKICKKLNSNLDDSDNITIESTKNEINIKILKDETD
jgi:hypothetical protein